MKTVIIDFIYYVLVIAALVVLARLLTSCSVTTYPDGSRTVAPDYNAWLKITELIITDEVPPIAPIVPTK